ncbi:MAG: alpha/beta hydrolase [Micavibrio sp.]|nr:alpha/beta hydrolase [Micavibrio sp.]
MFEGAINIPQALEERFTEPAEWRWHGFNRKGRKIRFGSVFPKDSIPDAVVVCLPGLSEFAEKYYETARWCLDNNLAFWVLDWMGQGHSERYISNHPHRRHITSFADDVEDLHYFIMGYIKHSSVHPDKGRIPLAMLAHSMGAHIGLRYLKQYPDMFECAAFTAPMLGLKVFNYFPMGSHKAIASLLNLYADKSYAPGGSDWREDVRANAGAGHFSGDAVRDAVHNQWCIANPDLQVGGVTNGWVHRAAQSCAIIQKPSFTKDIKTPCLMAMAGRDVLVDNKVTQKISHRMQDGRVHEYGSGQHELLMESDDIRGHFLDSFYKLITETIIERPETLKPF